MRTGLPFDDVLAAAQAGAGVGLRGALPRPVARRHRLPPPARRGRARRPRQRDLPRGLHRPGRLPRRRGGPAQLGLHHRPPPAGRRLAAAQPPSPGDRRPGDLTEHLGGDVEDDACVRVGTEDVHRMCAGLPDDQRSVLLLRILADLTVEQVAEVMGRSVGSVKALQRRGSADAARPAREAVGKTSASARTPGGPSGDDGGEMTTAADDSAVEDAFEAFLAGRPVPERAAGLAAFTGGGPGDGDPTPGGPMPPWPSCWPLVFSPTSRARPPGRPDRPGARRRAASRVRIRRRPAMIFPALLAKFLSAGAVAQAATGAGVVVVAATGAGATGALRDDVQDTFTTVVGGHPAREPSTLREDRPLPTTDLGGTPARRRDRSPRTVPWSPPRPRPRRPSRRQGVGPRGTGRWQVDR